MAYTQAVARTDLLRQAYNNQKTTAAVSTLLGTAQAQLATTGAVVAGRRLTFESIVGAFSAAASAFPLYLFIADTIIAIPAASAPKISIPLTAVHQSFSYSILQPFTLGIRLAISTTPTAYTAALAGDILNYQVTYYFA